MFSSGRMRIERDVLVETWIFKYKRTPKGNLKLKKKIVEDTSFAL